jgi:tetratricopeptide (TPR) repeat protein
MDQDNPKVEEMMLGIERLRTAGKLADALEVANKLVLFDSDCHRAYRVRALLHFDLRMHSAALQDMDSLVRLCPESPAPYFERGALSMELGRYAEVVDDMKSVIHIGDPFFLQSAYLYRAFASFKLGDKLDVIACCDQLPAGYGAYIITGLGKGSFVTREELNESACK